MIHYLFAFLLAIHGFIHLVGFSRAYEYPGVRQSQVIISRREGIEWLLAAALFITAAVLYFFNNDIWCIPAAAALVFSQVIIVIRWKQAKYGSIVNLLIVMAIIPAIAAAQFARATANESATELARVAGEARPPITEQMIDKLPPVVRKWMLHTGILGKERINAICLKQNGVLRTSVTGKWMNFQAKEYLTIELPQFIWIARVDMNPWIYLDARDKFENGRATMDISMYSIFRTAHVSDNNKSDTASLQRYISELCWVPSAALSNFISWQQTGPFTALATFNLNGMKVSGLFTFNDAGDIESFSADRYYSGDKDAKPEKWEVKSIAWKKFNGISVPYKSEVSWHFKTGNFHWASIEISDIQFNCEYLLK